MSEVESFPAVGAVSAAAGLSQWQRVTNIFSAPTKTFEDIQRGNRSWWLPLILIAVATYLLFAIITYKIGIQQVVENQIHMNSQAEARLAQVSQAQREMASSISLKVTQGTFIANPILTMIGIAVMSLGLLGTINFGFGGKASFGSIFAVFYYAILPSIIKTLLGIVVIFAGMAPESFNIKNFAPTNLGAFLNPLETNKALYALVTSLDIVQIWTLVLLGIGTATVAGVKRSSGYLAVFGWWVVFVLVGVGIAAIRG